MKKLKHKKSKKEQKSKFFSQSKLKQLNFKGLQYYCNLLLKDTS